MSFPLLSCSHLAMYQASLYLKINLTVCLFTHSKGILIGPSCQELRGVSKCPLAMNNPAGQSFPRDSVYLLRVLLQLIILAIMPARPTTRLTQPFFFVLRIKTSPGLLLQTTGVEHSCRFYFDWEMALSRTVPNVLSSFAFCA